MSLLSIFFYDDNVSNTEVSLWYFPFLPVLMSSKKLLSPTTPKLITDMLYPPPSLSAIKVGCPKHTRWGHHNF